MIKIKDKQYIEELLQRYYDGSSTIEEEQKLRKYFLSSNVDKALETEQQIFLSIAAMPPIGAEDRLKQSINRWERTEQKQRLRKRTIRWSSIAACITIAGFIGFATLKPEPEMKDTCKTPEEAYRETQRAVLMMSECFNRSEKAISTAEQKFAEAQKKLKNIIN